MGQEFFSTPALRIFLTANMACRNVLSLVHRVPVQVQTVHSAIRLCVRCHPRMKLNSPPIIHPQLLPWLQNVTKGTLGMGGLLTQQNLTTIPAFTSHSQVVQSIPSCHFQILQQPHQMYHDKPTFSAQWSASRYFSCFDSFQEKKSWINAQNKCSALGGSLASIHDTKTNEFIVTNMDHNDAWIGFNTIYAGDYEWSDGTDVGYQRWAPGRNSHIKVWRICSRFVCNFVYFSILEPDNGGILEDCVMMRGDSGGWDDRSW